MTTKNMENCRKIENKKQMNLKEKFKVLQRAADLTFSEEKQAEFSLQGVLWLESQDRYAMIRSKCACALHCDRAVKDWA